MTDQVIQLQAENERYKQQLAEFKAKERNEFLLGLINDGRLAPIARESASELLAYAEAVDNGEELAFSENESFTQKMETFLKLQPKAFEYLSIEIANKDNAPNEKQDNSVCYAENTPPEVIEADKQIRRYMEKNGVSYEDAFRMIYLEKH